RRAGVRIGRRLARRSSRRGRWRSGGRRGRGLRQGGLTGLFLVGLFLQDGEAVIRFLHELRLGVGRAQVAAEVLGGERALVELAIVDGGDVEQDRAGLRDLEGLEVGGDGLGVLARGVLLVGLIAELLGLRRGVGRGGRLRRARRERGCELDEHGRG